MRFWKPKTYIFCSWECCVKFFPLIMSNVSCKSHDMYKFVNGSIDPLSEIN